MNNLPVNTSCPALSLPPSFDISRVMHDVSTYFNPNKSDFLFDHHVTAVENEIAYVSFAMPVKMITAFVSLLQNMAEFLQIVNINVRNVAVTNRVTSPEEIERGNKIVQERIRKVCLAYDKHLSKGSSPKEALSLTNIEMKNANYNMSYDMVQNILRKAGKFRKNKVKSYVKSNKI